MLKCTETYELLMGYLDGELSPNLTNQVEEHLAECTECTREAAIYRNLKGLTAQLPFGEPKDRRWRSFWLLIHRRIARGIGWVLFLAGWFVFAVYGLYQFLTDPGLETILKLAAIGVLFGLFLLLISVGYERWQVYKTEPYKEVKR